MTDADNAAHASTAAIDAADVEAPVGLVDGSAVEVPESQGHTVSQASHDALRAERDALAAQFEQYRLHMIKVADRYTKRHGWCDQVQNAIAEIDPVAKMPVHSAVGEITITLRVEVKESNVPVTEGRLWNEFAALVSEVAYHNGETTKINTARYGTITGADSLVITQTGQVGLAPYVSPEEWRRQEQERERAAYAEQAKAEKERRERRRADGYYGTCGDCGANLDWRRSCVDQSCDEYVNPDSSDSF